MAGNPFLIDFKPVTNFLSGLQDQRNLETQRADSERHWSSQNAIAQAQLDIQKQNAARQAEEYQRQTALRSRLTEYLSSEAALTGVPKPLRDIAAIQGDASPVQNYIMAEAKRRAAQNGPEEFGKSGAIFQGPDGKFYSIQFGSRGQRSIQPVETGGHALSPARGVGVVGDEMFDKSTGAPIRTVAPQIAGKETAEKLGQAKGAFVSAYPKLELGIKSIERDNATVSAAIDRAIALIDAYGRGAAGMGAMLSTLPETAARQLKAELDTIKANQGFDKLQAMRDASPTGGALGAVSEFENHLLQSTGGNLSQDQRIDALRRTLNDIRAARNSLLSDRRHAFDIDRRRFGGPDVGQIGSPAGTGMYAPGAAAPAAPAASGGFSIRRLD